MTVCCANRKGGVGKTSTAGNVAADLARTHRVAMIDADPQGSLSSWLAPAGIEGELADVLLSRRAVSDVLVKVRDGLWIVPTRIGGELRLYAETRAGSEPFAFSDLVARLEEDGFEFVMVDLAPGLGTFEQGAVAASDRALLVLEPEFLSVEGLEGLLDDVAGIVQRRRSAVRYNWLVANRVNANFSRHRIYLDALASRWSDYRIFTVRQGAAVSESQTVHEPLDAYAPKDDRALPGYREIAEALRGDRHAQ